MNYGHFPYFIIIISKSISNLIIATSCHQKDEIFDKFTLDMELTSGVSNDSFAKIFY